MKRLSYRYGTARGLRCPGFSLLETLVALSLLGGAMLLTLSLLMQEPRTLRKLGAHEDVLRILEQSLEGIRAGRVVLIGRQPLDLSALSIPEDSRAQDLRLWSDKTQAPTSDLFELTLEARYRVGQQRFQRSLKTRIWEPPSL